MVPNVGSKWYDLGLKLFNEQQLCTQRLKNIRDIYPNDELQCGEMLECWINATPEATWNDLINALREINSSSIADNIKKEILQVSIL